MAEKERFFMPTIEPEQIGPERSRPEKREKARGERAGSLTKHIFRWWRGDAHTHSKESTREDYGYAEGIYDIQEIINYYKTLGLEFACFTEHASKPGSPEKQGLDSHVSQSLLQEKERIEQINQERGGDVMALTGVEANIFFDKDNQPALDLPEEVLNQLDLVIASRHAIAQEKKPKAIKETLLFAANHPLIDVIGHPDRYTRKDGETSPDYWQEYWDIWPEILKTMAQNNKAFEINLNNPPAPELLAMAADSGVKFFINFDAHDFNQYKSECSEINDAGAKAKNKWAKEEATDEDLEILERYKLSRLSSGPGVVAILKLARMIKKMESLGVTPDRVVNSSSNNLLDFLTKNRGKMTKNLEFLQSL